MAPRTSQTKPRIIYTKATKHDIKTTVHINFLHNTIKNLLNKIGIFNVAKVS